ncbi:MAG: FlgO family outer membrane protein, partial [Campylobacterota bacterium]|nr:FlgO family outer membrane protein [Campylobacterota bacterium]
MKKKETLFKIFLISLSIFVLGACSGKKVETLGYVPELDYVMGARNVNNEVTNIAIVPTVGQAALLTSSELDKHTESLTKNIIVTSMVDVNNFRQSSDFGRLYSESMMTNFKRLGWNVIDFRGKKLFVQAKSGEFYLDRVKLKDIPVDSIIYVGTYGEYQNGLLLNMRMLDYKTNKVVTASNVQLNDENALLLSKRSNCKGLGCESAGGNNF